MASLAETGLSNNIGISEREIPFGQQPVAVVHTGDYDPGSLRDRMASVFITDAGILPEPEEGKINLGIPRGSTRPFKSDPPTFRLLKPVFAQPYRPYEMKISGSDDVIVSEPDDAVVLNKEALLALIASRERTSDRGPNLVLPGSQTVRTFIESSLSVLDIRADQPLGEDKDGFYLTGDDAIASRLIQLAEISNVDVSGSIPAGHVDRALYEMVTTTLIDHYYWLCTSDIIGSMSGAWHLACMRFARAYKIEPGEIADLAIIHNDVIRAKAEMLDINKKLGGLPLFEAEVAAEMAEYLVSGVSRIRA